MLSDQVNGFDTGSDQRTKFYRNPDYGTNDRSDEGTLINQRVLISIWLNTRGRSEASGRFNRILTVGSNRIRDRIHSPG
jgi:hypothetical protein